MLGVLTTNLKFTEFVFHTTTFKYLVANLTFLNFLQPSLPGVFTLNPIQPMDGSLWTIKAEVMLYILLPCVIPLMTRKPILAYFLIYSISCFWFFYFTSIYNGPKAETLAKQFVSLSSYFFFGTFLVVYKKAFDKIKIISLFSLVVFFYFKLKGDILFLIEPIAYSSFVLFLCTSFMKEVSVKFIGDISYGIYLYHWPIIQLLIFLGVYTFNAFLGLLLTIILTLIASYISWNLLEKRFLQRTKFSTAKKNNISIATNSN
ncbi:acyltransferase [Erwinia sp. S43]|uniref:acyltransferase family protein n=1 Tax=Erwinia sp. S43 TaxID=2769339 RepID=UPI0021027F55|nr:acyltransferase family protein [Erwinia sp. S43]